MDKTCSVDGFLWADETSGTLSNSPTGEQGGSIHSFCDPSDTNCPQEQLLPNTLDENAVNTTDHVPPQDAEETAEASDSVPVSVTRLGHNTIRSGRSRFSLAVDNLIRACIEQNENADLSYPAPVFSISDNEFVDNEFIATAVETPLTLMDTPFEVGSADTVPSSDRKTVALAPSAPDDVYQQDFIEGISSATVEVSQLRRDHPSSDPSPECTDSTPVRRLELPRLVLLHLYRDYYVRLIARRLRSILAAKAVSRIAATSATESVGPIEAAEDYQLTLVAQVIAALEALAATEDTEGVQGDRRFSGDIIYQRIRMALRRVSSCFRSHRSD